MNEHEVTWLQRDTRSAQLFGRAERLLRRAEETRSYLLLAQVDEIIDEIELRLRLAGRMSHQPEGRYERSLLAHESAGQRVAAVHERYVPL